jgi:hypothetical protein
MQMINQISEQMQAMRAERQADHEDMQTQIHALQSAISTPTITPQPATVPEIIRPEPQRSVSPESPLKKKPTLPNPPKFDGTRRNFRPWYLEMRAKLSLDRCAFRSDKERFAYVYARLEGTAQNMAAAYFEQGSLNGSQSPDEFLDYLNRRYGDPNAKGRALDRLRTLRQRPNESFATFFLKFEKELADSGGGSWDNAVQINYLEGAINNKLGDYLISVPNIPTDFNAYTELLLTIGSRLDSRDYQARQQYRNSSPEDNYHKQPLKPLSSGNADQMDWEPTKVNKSGSKRDQDSRRCFGCGKVGHIIAYCKQSPKELQEARLPKGRQEKTKAARSAPKKSDPGIDSDSSSRCETLSDEDSENE